MRRKNGLRSLLLLVGCMSVAWSYWSYRLNVISLPLVIMKAVDQDVAGTTNNQLHMILSSSTPSMSLERRGRMLKSEESTNAIITASTKASTGLMVQNKTTQSEVYDERQARSSPNLTLYTRGKPNFSMNNQMIAAVPENFVHHPGVVIVTKVHSMEEQNAVQSLRQSLCLLQAAYNYRVLYDIVVFTATLSNNANNTIASLQRLIHPSKLQVVLDDERTLHEQLMALDIDQQQTLIQRCHNVSTIHDMQWTTRCQEGRRRGRQGYSTLAYTWMSEFRSKYIWTHDALQKYKYMMWIDSDSFAMNQWEEDPVAFLIRNNLVLLMGNFGGGSTPVKTGVQDKIYQIYNKTLCSQALDSDGRLVTTYGYEGMMNNSKPCRTGVRHAHGFFHITDLDFYRLPIHLEWQSAMIGRHKFSRTWDDQLAVMVPAAMMAPERTMEMEAAGLNSSLIMHNGMITGKHTYKGGGFLKYWNREGRHTFHRAKAQCPTKGVDQAIGVPA